MAFNFNMSFGSPPAPKVVERDNSGNWLYRITGGSKRDSINTQHKVKLALKSPVFMSPAIKVMDLASQANIVSLDSEDKVISNHALHELMPRANGHQTWTEFIAQVMLYAKLGVAIIYIPHNNLNEGNTIHCLKPENIIFDHSVIKSLLSIIGLKEYKKESSEKTITYRLENGATQKYRLDHLHLISTLPIGIKDDNIFENLSLLDVLLDPILNAKEILELDYQSSKLAKKVVVGEKKSGVDLSLPQGEPEKISIEQSVSSDKLITATNKDIQVKRMYESKSGLDIIETYKMYANISEDMLGVSPDIGAFGRSTFNNQQLATGRTIEFAVMPILEKLLEIIEQNSELKNLRADFSHMSFNQVFEELREKKNETKLDNIIKALSNGLISQEQATELTKQIFE